MRRMICVIAVALSILLLGGCASTQPPSKWQHAIGGGIEGYRRGGTIETFWMGVLAGIIVRRTDKRERNRRKAYEYGYRPPH